MEVTLSGIEMDDRLVHLWNAPSPMEVTLSGMETEVRLLQLLKTYPPIEVTVSGIITDVRFSHFSNAKRPMPVTGYFFIMCGMWIFIIVLSFIPVMIALLSSIT